MGCGNSQQIKITNPMVISICIGYYDEMPKSSDIDGHLRDLDGVRNDYKKMKDFCIANNYTIFPNNEQFQWNHDQVIDFIKSKAKECNNDGCYDSILVTISCHGGKDYIICSDYKVITKQTIHRLFSNDYDKLRIIPRIFIFDCDDEPQLQIINDPQSIIENDAVWMRDSVNVDHKLVVFSHYLFVFLILQMYTMWNT